MKRTHILTAATLTALASVSLHAGAECKVGDQWYSYEHPKCSGSQGGSGSSSTAPSGGVEFVQWEIERRDLVSDTHVELDGDEVILVAIMNAAVNERYAREIGESFVRLYITFAPDETGNPGKYIGETQYDYSVAIADRRGEIMYSAAKVAFARELYW